MVVLSVCAHSVLSATFILLSSVSALHDYHEDSSYPDRRTAEADGDYGYYLGVQETLFARNAALVARVNALETALSRRTTPKDTSKMPPPPPPSRYVCRRCGKTFWTVWQDMNRVTCKKCYEGHGSDLSVVRVEEKKTAEDKPNKN